MPKPPVVESAPEQGAEVAAEVQVPVVPQPPVSLSPPVQKEVELPKAKAKSGPIQVVATRKGFFNNHRLNEGDKFVIDSEDQLGSWMKKI
jgi:hypothetical protein